MVDDHDLLIRIDERIEGIVDDIKVIKKSVYGNGSSGLCDRVSKNELRIEEIYTANVHRIRNIQILVTCTTAIILAAVAIFNLLS